MNEASIDTVRRIAVYPGSFNPFHKGHNDVLTKASKIFDIIYVAKYSQHEMKKNPVIRNGCYIQYINFYDKLLVDLVKELNAEAVVRGLRNGTDLQYEMNQQYWNEDLGLNVPIVYFITDRKLSHISSSAIREIKCLKTKQ